MPGTISLGVCFVSLSASLPPALGHADTFPHQWGSGCGPAPCWAALWPCQGWLWCFCWSLPLCWGHRNREILLPKPDKEPGMQVRAGCSSLFKRSFCCSSSCKLSLWLSLARPMVAVLERTKSSICTGPEALRHQSGCGGAKLCFGDVGQQSSVCWECLDTTAPVFVPPWGGQRAWEQEVAGSHCVVGRGSLSTWLSWGNQSKKSPIAVDLGAGAQQRPGEMRDPALCRLGHSFSL